MGPLTRAAATGVRNICTKHDTTQPHLKPLKLKIRLLSTLFLASTDDLDYAKASFSPLPPARHPTRLSLPCYTSPREICTYDMTWH
ncbi:hypothetical protein E2C01_087976 [Portunus trituberculatus]|uniref:Uncharacterized protein n=1 Tax=Portunus trituberculatus TaxID=210409 RepID=A0A5B7JKR4_PORTR|nr:hypothetical protein [Portunus trituberculatus]